MDVDDGRAFVPDGCCSICNDLRSETDIGRFESFKAPCNPFSTCVSIGTGASGCTDCEPCIPTMSIPDISDCVDGPKWPAAPSTRSLPSLVVSCDDVRSCEASSLTVVAPCPLSTSRLDVDFAFVFVPVPASTAVAAAAAARSSLFDAFPLFLRARAYSQDSPNSFFPLAFQPFPEYTQICGK